MSKLATRPPASQGGWPLPETVRAFLLESERRVLAHCAATAGEQMQRLAGTHEIKAA